MRNRAFDNAKKHMIAVKKPQFKGKVACSVYEKRSTGICTVDNVDYTVKLFSVRRKNNHFDPAVVHSPYRNVIRIKKLNTRFDVRFLKIGVRF